MPASSVPVSLVDEELPSAVAAEPVPSLAPSPPDTHEQVTVVE
jgi:hypothetical protein